MGFCPECGNELITRDNQDVCMGCGLVVHENKYSQVIPVGTVQTPPSSFSHSRGMGGTIQEKGIFALIGKERIQPWKCPNCGKEFNDMPQRAQLLKMSVETNDHPRIATLIKLGKQRARQFGWGEENKADRAKMFKQFLGNRLRDVGSLMVFRTARLSAPQLVDVCFALAVKEVWGDQKFMEVESRLALSAVDIEEFGYFYNVTQKHKRSP